MMRQPGSRTTARNGTNVTPVGKHPTVFGTVAAAVVGHVLVVALVFPMAVAGVILAAVVVGLVAKTVHRGDTDASLGLLSRANAEKSGHARDHTAPRRG
jgi:hypothetical protein